MLSSRVNRIGGVKIEHVGGTLALVYIRGHDTTAHSSAHFQSIQMLPVGSSLQTRTMMIRDPDSFDLDDIEKGEEC